MTRLTELLGGEVVAEDGARLGRLRDVRAEPTAVGHDACAVVALICGPIGLLERLGFKSRRLQSVAWHDVQTIEGKRLTVRKRASMSSRSGPPA